MNDDILLKEVFAALRNAQRIAVSCKVGERDIELLRPVELEMHIKGRLSHELANFLLGELVQGRVIDVTKSDGSFPGSMLTYLAEGVFLSVADYEKLLSIMPKLIGSLRKGMLT